MHTGIVNFILNLKLKPSKIHLHDDCATLYIYLHDLQRLDLAAAQLLDLGVFLALERLLGAADALLHAGLQLPLLVLQPLDDLARLLEMIHRCRQPQQVTGTCTPHNKIGIVTLLESTSTCISVSIAT